MIDAPHSVADILAVVGDRKVKAIVCTHAHDDHVRVAPALREEVVAPIMLHPDDKPLWELTHTDYLWDLDLADGVTIEVGGTTLQVLHTPGHAPGAVCLYAPDLGCVFTGDTLFNGGPGATGRSYSDSDLIKESIRAKLFALPDDTVVHTGHGDDTTIGAEKADASDWRSSVRSGATRSAVPAPATRVSTIVASSSPRRASRLRSCSGTTSTPRFLMVSRPMPRSRSAARELLLPVGELLDDAVAAGERRTERLVGGHVGDVLVDQPAVDPGGHRGDQPGADHGAVRLVEVGADRRVPRAPGVVLVGQRREAGRRRSRSRGGRWSPAGPDHSAASLTSPWSLTHSASTPSGTRSWGMPGATFTQASRVEQPLDERPRRRPVVDVEGPAAGAAPGRVGEGDVERRRVDASSRRRPTTAPGRPRASRLARATSTRTGSRSTPAQVSPARDGGDQVAADAAAEVDHGLAPTTRPAGRRGARRPAAGWPARARRA